MAQSRYEYVKQFEQHTSCLPQTFIVLRIDGRGFSRFSKNNSFEKPNDLRALQVMDKAALALCDTFKDIFLAYGQSDEFSFVFDLETDLFNRRREKIVSTTVSLFTAHYLLNFQKIFEKTPDPLPVFDCRIILYPSLAILRDYFNWRQVDCHINNLYNTCFWELVQKDGKSPKEAEQFLCGTLSDFKNEYLFKKGINYSKIEPIFRKGSLVKRVRYVDPEKLKKYEELKEKNQKVKPPREKTKLVLSHEDLIQDEFWIENFPELMKKFSK